MLGVKALGQFSGCNRPLDALIPVHTEYGYLECEGLCIFYLENSDNVVIVRILLERNGCLATLFYGEPY